MRRLVPVLLVMALPLLLASTGEAQTTRADTAAVLLDVATRLQTEGRASLSRSLLDLIIERYSGTPAAEAARLARAQVRPAVEERSGRTELLVWATTYGLALGAAVPGAFDANEPEAYGVGLLVGGPAGFGVGRLLAKEGITEGQARAITFGSLWGAWQAFGWREVLDIGDPDPLCLTEPDGPELCYERDAEGSTKVRAAILGSFAGLGTGVLLAKKPIASGTATTVNLGALWGSWFGVAGAVLGNFDEGDEALTWALLGGNAGLVATALLAPKWNLSRNRARLISISGVAGGLAGAGLLLIGGGGDNTAILIPVVGSIAGLGLGVHWTRNYDERAPGNNNDGGEALLEWRDGEMKVGTPTPTPMLLRTSARDVARVTPALHVPLFKARW